MPIDLDDPIALMLVAAAALERSGTECTAYGGLALGMYGEARETRDADFAVTGVDLERARLALADRLDHSPDPNGNPTTDRGDPGSR